MNIEVARKWYKQALHDLEIAEKNIDIAGYDVSAFLSQQAVEKLLKAIYAIEGKKIPRTHYLDDLAKGLNITKQEIIDKILSLTTDYTFARYPDVTLNVPYEHYTKEIAETKLKYAKDIFKFLEDRYLVLIEG